MKSLCRAMNYCMAEQENIWESYKVIIQRLRLYVDNPFVAREGGFADEDNSQLLSSLRYSKGNKLHRNELPLFGLNPIDAP